MTTRFTLKASFIAFAVLALPMAQAAALAKADYKSDCIQAAGLKFSQH